MTREEAVKRLQRMKKILSIPNSDAARTIEAIDMAIEALQQEPKRGKWLNYLKEGLKWKCSECGSKYTTPWHYCPNCGARMESDDE